MHQNANVYDLPTLELPSKLAFLFEPYRFKVLWGGRGGGKSVTVAIVLLLLGMQKKHRILCTREFQNSIDESVYAVLVEYIRLLEINWFYRVLNSKIIGNNGTEFIFAGLQGRSIGSVKSKFGITIVWVEEAQYVSTKSFEILTPTIREEGAECWITFNPELEEDEVYQRFVAYNEPNSCVCKINWYDNPFISQTLIAEKDSNYARNEERAYYIWEGVCKPALEGAIYAKELQLLEASGRIASVPHNPLLPVYTYWDLGISDSTCVWFAQHYGAEHRFIDYYENNGEQLRHYVDILHAKTEKYGYKYEAHYFPHDVQVSELITGKTRYDTLIMYGLENVSTVPRVKKIETGIDETRQILPLCYFDKIKCKDGLYALKSYRYEYDEKRKVFKPKPAHTHASNGSDAFRQFAQTFNPSASQIKPLNYEPLPYWAQ